MSSVSGTNLPKSFEPTTAGDSGLSGTDGAIGNIAVRVLSGLQTPLGSLENHDARVIKTGDSGVNPDREKGNPSAPKQGVSDSSERSGSQASSPKSHCCLQGVSSTATTPSPSSAAPPPPGVVPSALRVSEFVKDSGDGRPRLALGAETPSGRPRLAATGRPRLALGAETPSGRPRLALGADDETPSGRPRLALGADDKTSIGRHRLAATGRHRLAATGRPSLAATDDIVFPGNTAPVVGEPSDDDICLDVRKPLKFVLPVHEIPLSVTSPSQVGSFGSSDQTTPVSFANPSPLSKSTLSGSASKNPFLETSPVTQASSPVNRSSKIGNIEGAQVEFLQVCAEYLLSLIDNAPLETAVPGETTKKDFDGQDVLIEVPQASGDIRRAKFKVLMDQDGLAHVVSDALINIGTFKRVLLGFVANQAQPVAVAMPREGKGFEYMTRTQADHGEDLSGEAVLNRLTEIEDGEAHNLLLPKSVVKAKSHPLYGAQFFPLMEQGSCEAFFKEKIRPVLASGETEQKRDAVKQALSLFQDAIRGTGYLHSKGFSHNDIKPGNILLSQGKGYVSDTEGLGEHLLNAKSGRTPHYSSPESHLGEGGNRSYDGKASDVWSLGVSFFELLKGELFYSTFDSFTHQEPGMLAMTLQTPESIKRYQVKIDKAIDSYIPEDMPKANEIKELLKLMIRVNNEDITLTGPADEKTVLKGRITIDEAGEKVRRLLAEISAEESRK